jgi:hypothetical protein
MPGTTEWQYPPCDAQASTGQPKPGQPKPGQHTQQNPRDPGNRVGASYLEREQDRAIGQKRGRRVRCMEGRRWSVCVWGGGRGQGNRGVPSRGAGAEGQESLCTRLGTAGRARPGEHALKPQFNSLEVFQSTKSTGTGDDHGPTMLAANDTAMFPGWSRAPTPAGSHPARG